MALSTLNPIWTRLERSQTSVSRPANNRPSYGTALHVILFSFESHSDDGDKKRIMLNFQYQILFKNRLSQSLIVLNVVVVCILHKIIHER